MAIKIEHNIRYWFSFSNMLPEVVYKSKSFEAYLIRSNNLTKQDILANLQIPNESIIFSSKDEGNLVLTPDALNELSKNLKLFIDYEVIEDEE